MNETRKEAKRTTKMEQVVFVVDNWRRTLSFSHTKHIKINSGREHLECI
jgi:hypothetical protein